MSHYYDLGNYTRPVTTTSPAAQKWFDRGLVWCYGFNHEEASRCFHQALNQDLDCAMAYWGIAYANGPFYNKPWEFFGQDELAQAVVTCYEAVQKALALSHSCTASEQALIQALSYRYPLPQVVTQATFDNWDANYAQAMQAVHTTFPYDADVIALYAEAMMTKTPWQLWNIYTGQPAPGADTVIAVQILEAGLRLMNEDQIPPHPGILHMVIHALEMSPQPEKALPAAAALRDLAPDSGHLCHMPTHIDALCGHYTQAVVASEKAIAADKKYLAQVGSFGFYTTAVCHDIHMLMYVAMLSGQYKQALTAVHDLTQLLTEEVLRVDIPHLASTLEGYYSMNMHVFVRFGQWQAIIATPLPPDPQLYCVTTVMHHYAKGVAHSALGNIAAAEEERHLFTTAVARVPLQRRFFNNSALDILAVASEMLNGELTYRQGHHQTAYTHLRQAAYLDDHLAYTEPWAWMHPPRHALGALLLEQGHMSEAEQVYRADLGLDGRLPRPLQHPNNVWSLHGYAECLQRLNETDEATVLQPHLTQALAHTDIEITASCCCRLEQHCCH